MVTFSLASSTAHLFNTKLTIQPAHEEPGRPTQPPTSAPTLDSASKYYPEIKGVTNRTALVRTTLW